MNATVQSRYCLKYSFKLKVSPGEHAEERVDDLPCESNTHLDSQRLEQRQEEGQHLICHICTSEIKMNKIA